MAAASSIPGSVSMMTRVAGTPGRMVSSGTMAMLLCRRRPGRCLRGFLASQDTHSCQHCPDDEVFADLARIGNVVPWDQPRRCGLMAHDAGCAFGATRLPPPN